MARIIAIHQIEYRNVNGDPAVAEPGTEFDIADDAATRLLDMGAARAVAVAEPVIFADAPAAAPKKRGRKAADPKPEAEAVIPEVVLAPEVTDPVDPPVFKPAGLGTDAATTPDNDDLL